MARREGLDQFTAEQQTHDEKRRFLLRGLGIGAGALSVLPLLAACGSQKPGTKDDFMTVAEIYPEAASLAFTAMGEFETKHGKTRWLNTTSFPFNPDAYAQIIAYFDGLPSRLGFVNYSDGNTTLPFTVRPLETKRRTLCLVPNNTATPKEIAHVDPTSKAATVIDDPARKTFTFVKLEGNGVDGDIKTIIAGSGDSTPLAVEAAQSSIVVNAQMNSNIKPGAAVTLHHIGQEMISNSYGRSLILRQLGLSYNDYLAAIGTFVVNLPLPGIAQKVILPGIAAPKSEYGQMPVIAPLFR